MTTLAEVTNGIDWRMLTQQRAHLLATIAKLEGKPVAARYTPDPKALLGILNLLDALTDAADNEGRYWEGEGEQAWAEGSISAGMGDPREDS